MDSGRKFKIKLSSGRILGPLELERVRLLMLKNQITGVETARVHPDGEWKSINQIPDLAELLLAKLEGRLESIGSSHVDDQVPVGGDESVDLESVSVGLPEEPPTAAPAPPPIPDRTVALGQSRGSDLPPPEPVEIEREAPSIPAPADEATQGRGSDFADDQFGDGEKTMIAPASEISRSMRPSVAPTPAPFEPSEPSRIDMQPQNRLSEERTVFFQRSTPVGGSATVGEKKGLDRAKLIRLILIAGIAYVGYDTFLGTDEPPPKPLRAAAIRPQLPAFISEGSDPGASKQLYQHGLKSYLEDTVTGYKTASEDFLKAASLDQTNVQALALLASSYLNLIDSSNKDEKYFGTISKLIELSRAKDVDLAETVIADVEFFTTANRPEAAQNRIVEYTKVHPNFDYVMFYYLAYAFFRRGDSASAAKYISQIPDNKVFSPKVFYLKGQILQILGSAREALTEYDKAIKLSPSHVRSRLAIARAFSQDGHLRDAGPHLDYILQHPDLSPPLPLAEAYYLHGLLNELNNKNPMAMADIEKAVKLNPENHDYLLELYTLRAKAGETDPKFKDLARMYYFLGEGERKLKGGNPEAALADFLQARDAEIKSPIPLEKIGDMFLQLNNMIDATMNYRKAAEMAPEDIDIWSKYIQTLIQSYELNEASEAMKKFKNVPGARSSIDKLFGDLYEKQSMHAEAQVHYRLAMGRDSIDPRVYVAYANSLRESGLCADAPFYYALGLRLDPLNMEAIVGTAKCVASTDSVQRAVTMLQDELQKLGGARAELIAAVAELRIQTGDWDLAQDSIDAALGVNPKYAYTWLLQAKVHLNKVGLDKDAMSKALADYKSYIERNPSDPLGYLERYRIFVRLGQFDKASDELGEIFKLYPKYPGLHFFKGTLYSTMGNVPTAVAEFQQELEANPNSPEAMVALGKEMMKDTSNKDAAANALNLFTKAMQLAPNSPEAKQEAGWASFHLKNYTGAIALLQAAAATDAGNPVIYKRMGIVYRAMGDGASAATAFKKYMQLSPDAPDRAEFEQFAE